MEKYGKSAPIIGCIWVKKNPHLNAKIAYQCGNVLNY
jgi:hypothetical protein